MALVELLKRSEGKTIEFKRDLSSPEGILRSIVAFANTSGGDLLIGVEDKTRRVRGVDDPLAFEERVANLISDGISPRLLPEIDVLPFRRTHVVAVRVHPSSNLPHFVKRLGPEEGVFVRVGSTNRKADRELIEELRRFARRESFDEQPLAELNSEAIDFKAASESFSQLRTLKRSDLLSLRITTTHQGKEVPTVGGFLLFGKDRQSLFPDAWIQVGRFEGRDKSRILDTVAIYQLPVRAIEETIAFIQKHTTREVVIGEIRRVERWTLPPPAVREAVINAVVHTDYAQRGAPIRVSIFDDRLEVENPGLLLFGLTIEDIQKGVSKLRNRVVGRVFHELGLIEQWGSGIQRMTSVCREAGLGAPILEEIGTRFRVTLSAVRRSTPALDEMDRKILTVLAKRRETGLSTRELSEKVGLSTRATRTRLVSLVGRGLVIEVGTSPQDPQRRYFVVETAA